MGLVASPGERHADADARVLLNAATRPLGRLRLSRISLKVLDIRGFNADLLLGIGVLAAVHDERCMACRDKLLEDLRKVGGNLLERARDGLVLLVIERLMT